MMPCLRIPLLLNLVLWLLRAAHAQNFSVSAGSFARDNMILLRGADITIRGSLTLIPELTSSRGSPAQSAGLGYYLQPVRLVDKEKNMTASFSIWFKSYQVPEAYFANNQTYSLGDGMTLCFSSRPDYSGLSAKYLGLYGLAIGDPNLKLFSIEYDTRQNWELKDPNYDHVGINVLNPTSVAFANTGIDLWKSGIGAGVYLYSWVEYNGKSKIMEVRVADQNTRPVNPTLSHTIDLYNIMEEWMWVGFSAGTGDSFSYYYVEEWNFTSWGLGPMKKFGSSSSEELIVGCVVGAVVVIAVGLGLGFCIRLLRRRRDGRAGKEFQSLVGMPDFYSYRQLSLATRAFDESTKLGEGGFGTVHQGILPTNGLAVAVKRVSAESKQGQKEFLAEVSIISQLRHRNIVQLVGWCRDKEKFLLVYELMPNGSLDKALFHPKSVVLSWQQRLKIVSGLASALHYLHEGWKQQVIHRDVKSSNIMLDNEFNAKLGDFGLARLVDHSRNATTTLVAGTYGYIAPEATVTGKFTDKTDVYAFGAVALEVVTGRKACDSSEKEDDIHLVDMVWRRLGTGQLITVVDRRLEGKFEVSELEMVLCMGLLCSHPDPNSRPSMRQVVQVLAGDAPVPPVPGSKPLALFSSSSHSITIQDLHGSRSSGDDLSGMSSHATTSTFTSSSLSKSPSAGSRLEV